MLKGCLSLAQARCLEACRRAGRRGSQRSCSGRRGPQVDEAATPMGQTWPIYTSEAASSRSDGETTRPSGEGAHDVQGMYLCQDRGRGGSWSSFFRRLPRATRSHVPWNDGCVFDSTSSAARFSSTRRTLCSGEHGDDDLGLVEQRARSGTPTRPHDRGAHRTPRWGPARGSARPRGRCCLCPRSR